MKFLAKEILTDGLQGPAKHSSCWSIRTSGVRLNNVGGKRLSRVLKITTRESISLTRVANNFAHTFRRESLRLHVRSHSLH